MSKKIECEECPHKANIANGVSGDVYMNGEPAGDRIHVCHMNPSAPCIGHSIERKLPYSAHSDIIKVVHHQYVRVDDLILTATPIQPEIEEALLATRVADWPPVLVRGRLVVDGVQRALVARRHGIEQIPGKKVN